MATDSKGLRGTNRTHDAATAAAWRALVERICDSAPFRKAARMKELLVFLTSRAIEEPDKEISEYEIASQVFRRGGDFDPAESNVVRVAVRQLRAKIKEYYEDSGRREPWLVEIPRGGYGPVFTSRDPAPADGNGAERRTGWPVPLGIGMALGLAIAALAWALLAPRPGAPPTSRAPFLARLVASFEGPVKVVAADSAYVMMRQFGARPENIEEYESGRYTDRVRAGDLPSGVRGVWSSLLTRQFLNMADVNIAYRLAACLHPRPPGIAMARHLKTREFRAGNFVILGAGTSNPWHLLFEDQLNFHYRDEPGKGLHIVNRAPRAGEAARYGPSKPTDEDSFGLAAMVQNLAGTGKVVLIAGVSMEATEASGDFLLKPKFRDALLQKLGVGSEAELSGFEVVLRTRSISGTARSAEVVAVRAKVGRE